MRQGGGSPESTASRGYQTSIFSIGRVRKLRSPLSYRIVI